MNGTLKQILEMTLNCYPMEKALECLNDRILVLVLEAMEASSKFLMKLEPNLGVTITSTETTSGIMTLKCYQMEM